MIVFFSWTKNLLHKKGFHLASFWKWEFLELWNGMSQSIAIFVIIIIIIIIYLFIYLSFSLFFIVRLSNMQLHLSQGTWIMSSWLDVEWCEMQMCRNSYHRFEETLE